MPEQGFEMIRGRLKKFADRKDPVPDQTKPARKSQLGKAYKIPDKDKPTQKRKEAEEPIETSAVTREHPKKMTRALEDAPKVFISPERRHDVPNVYEKGLQKVDMGPLEVMRYCALKNARDTLLALIKQDEDGISAAEQIEIADLIEKQTEIVEKLRLKWNTPITNSGEDEGDSQVDSNRGVGGHKFTGEEVCKPKQKRAATGTQSPSPASSPQHLYPHSRTPAPKKKSRKSKKYTPPPPSPRIAFPASAPTTLPAKFRTRKDLTTEEIAEKAKVHPSFDESAGKKIDKHTRRINCTSGIGMVAGMISNPRTSHCWTLEEQIRVPSDSPEPDLSESWTQAKLM